MGPRSSHCDYCGKTVKTIFTGWDMDDEGNWFEIDICPKCLVKEGKEI
jgi:hypothetical protein